MKELFAKIQEKPIAQQEESKNATQINSIASISNNERNDSINIIREVPSTFLYSNESSIPLSIITENKTNKYPNKKNKSVSIILDQSSIQENGTHTNLIHNHDTSINHSHSTQTSAQKHGSNLEHNDTFIAKLLHFSKQNALEFKGMSIK